MERKALIERKTTETSVKIEINLDGQGSSAIGTGIGFLDHMLVLLSKHGGFDLEVLAEGDLNVDGHHTIEDVGIVLGQALNAALGERASISRYGSGSVPMDESLAQVNVDLGGRAFLVFNAEFPEDMTGQFPTSMLEEFFRAVAFNSGMTLHINLLYGKNTHHMIEAIFKAFARALKEAVTVDEVIKGVLSSKGIY
jgi:imidazoleglycerol-phosphate dehydratase